MKWIIQTGGYERSEKWDQSQEMCQIINMRVHESSGLVTWKVKLSDRWLLPPNSNHDPTGKHLLFLIMVRSRRDEDVEFSRYSVMVKSQGWTAIKRIRIQRIFQTSSWSVAAWSAMLKTRERYFASFLKLRVEIFAFEADLDFWRYLWVTPMLLSIFWL